jgi:hypothetical protein
LESWRIERRWIDLLSGSCVEPILVRNPERPIPAILRALAEQERWHRRDGAIGELRARLKTAEETERQLVKRVDTFAKSSFQRYYVSENG